jgi:thioester reductase-like protein
MHQQPAVELNTDATLDLSRRPTRFIDERDFRTAGNTVLLTGVPGNLGRFLCAELLRRTATRIYCLVRDGRTGPAKQRLHATLAGAGVPDRELHRVVAVAGDLTKPYLGLPPDELITLADRLGAIYHCAADVRLGGTYARLRAANVAGTAEIARLALAGRRPIPIHHASTLSVFLAARFHDHVERRAVSEHDEPEVCCAGQVGYARTKSVAELLMRQAREHGVPVTVYRLPLLIAHSTTGACAENEYLAALIRAAVHLGVAPAGSDADGGPAELALPVCAVDHAAAAIAVLATSPSPHPTGGTGDNPHVLAPRALPLAEVFARVRHAGYRLRTVSTTRWHELVRQHRHDPEVRAMWALSDVNAHLIPVERTAALPAVDSTRTQRALLENGFRIPPADDAFLDRMIDHLRTIGKLKDVIGDDRNAVNGTVRRTDEIVGRR